MQNRAKRILMSAAVLLAGAGLSALGQERPPPAAGENAPGVRAPGELRPGMRGAKMEEAMERFKEQLQTQNPGEYQRLMELREKDPEAYRKEIRDFFAKRGRGEVAAPGVGTVSDEEKVCQELAKKFMETKDPAEAAKVKADLQKAVSLAFDKRLERQKQRLADLESRIKTVREQIQTRQANKDKVCELRVEELTRDSSLGWGAE